MMLIEDMMNWLPKESLFESNNATFVWKLLTINDRTAEENKKLMEALVTLKT
jgi:hypothetical protein